METPALQSFRQEFEMRARWRREEKQRVLEEIKLRDDREERQKLEQKREDEFEDVQAFAQAILATDSEIADFHVKLDTYDAATIEALMENEKALKEVREKLRIVMDKAYVLPDGRRVFKTEDGTRVFDEHGQEVTGFDPQLIEEQRPRWEQLKRLHKEQDALTEERRDLIDYQEQLDEVREEADKDDLTKDELKELEKRLEGDMPEAVKRHLKQDDENAPRSDRDREPEQPAFRTGAKLDMPVL